MAALQVAITAVCRARIDTQKLKARIGYIRKRIRCAKRVTQMFHQIANTQAESEKITGSLCDIQLSVQT